MKRTAVSLAFGALLASALAPCVSAAPLRTEATATKRITVTAGRPMELRFRLSSMSAPKGLVIFTVTNVGALDHDFKIKGKKTRVLSSGERSTLQVTFTRSGRYQFLCTIPGHAAAGMKGTFRIT